MKKRLFILFTILISSMISSSVFAASQWFTCKVEAIHIGDLGRSSARFDCHIPGAPSCATGSVGSVSNLWFDPTTDKGKALQTVLLFAYINQEPVNAIGTAGCTNPQGDYQEIINIILEK